MFNIAFVGHVDHGKSTLIGRLLYDTNSLPEGKLEEIERVCRELGRSLEFAYICDALEEERKNQMTIETSQTFFRSEGREYVIIDAPGHKEFLKNMVTGVSQADAGILIVDVREGVMEQTKRHAYLLKLLGISNVIVVINKMDLVGYRKENFERVKQEVLDYLSRIGISPKHVIPISAYEGDNVVNRSKNMGWYRGLTLIEALDSLKKTMEFSDLRLPIQDVYSMNEPVYVGNVLSGKLRKGEVVKRYPDGKEVRIKRILDGEREVELVCAPRAVGLVVDKKLKRGNVLASGSEPIVTNGFSCLVFCLIGSIAEGEEYVLRCSTQEVKCKVNKILEKIDVESLEKREAEELREAEIGKLNIGLEKQIVVEKFNRLKELGRFVLLKDGKILGGGIV